MGSTCRPASWPSIALLLLDHRPVAAIRAHRGESLPAATRPEDLNRLPARRGHLGRAGPDLRHRLVPLLHETALPAPAPSSCDGGQVVHGVILPVHREDLHPTGMSIH